MTERPNSRKKGRTSKDFRRQNLEIPATIGERRLVQAADFLLDYCYQELLVGTAETTSQWTQHESFMAPNKSVMTVIRFGAHNLRVSCAQDRI